MADRKISDPRSGEQRQAAPRVGEQRQAAPRSGEQRQAVPRSGEQRQAVPRSGEQRQAAPRSGEQRQAAPRGSSDRRQAPSRRNDVIRCENCGEDYSITYKRCPFCDERPGRGGIAGKRVANTRGGGYGRPINPIQVAGLVISLILIISALFIVWRFVGAPLFGGGNRTPGSSQSTSGSVDSTGSQSTSRPNTSTSQPQNPDGSGGSISIILPPAVQSITLSRSEFTLDNGESWTITATLLPAGVTGDVIWSSSNTAVATVDAGGTVTNVNTGKSNTKVTITASCGDVSAECAVYCKPKSGGGGTTTPGSGTVASGTQGTIVNASTGLNIRSGPGREYDIVASASNGAKVTILGEENGWYQITYSGSKTGYVSKDYVSVG
mgnify:CR=1 FL=1